MDLKRAQAFRWFTCLINLRGNLVELGRLQHLEVFCLTVRNLFYFVSNPTASRHGEKSIFPLHMILVFNVFLPRKRKIH